MLVAIKNRSFSSKGMKSTIYKVAAYSLALIAVHSLTHHTVAGRPNPVLRLFVEYLDATLYTFIVFREALSIHENLKKMGYGLLPEFLEEKIKHWLSKDKN